MLKKRNRLSKFGKIENTKNVSSSLFTLKISDQKQEIPRFGFIVSKKIDKRATVRNKTRRVLQSAVQEIIEDILPYTYLLIAKKEIGTEDKKNITMQVKEIFKKEKLLK